MGISTRVSAFRAVLCVSAVYWSVGCGGGGTGVEIDLHTNLTVSSDFAPSTREVPGYVDDLEITLIPPVDVTLPVGYVTTAVLDRSAASYTFADLPVSALVYRLSMSARTGGNVVGTTVVQALVDGSEIEPVDVSANMQTTVDSIEIDGILGVTSGGTSQLTARAIDGDGSTLFTGAGFTWTSDDHSVATVDSDGNVYAGGFGATNITASLDGSASFSTVSFHSAAVSYRLVDLGSSGPSWSIDISEEGAIVGFLNPPDDERPFFWSQSTGLIEMGLPEGYDKGWALGVNDHNEVIGSILREAVGTKWQPYVWSESGGYQVLTIETFAFANAINDAGVIVGEARGTEGYYFFRKAPGEPAETLVPLTGDERVEADTLDEAGSVYGQSYTFQTGIATPVKWIDANLPQIIDLDSSYHDIKIHDVSQNGWLTGRVRAGFSNGSFIASPDGHMIVIDKPESASSIIGAGVNSNGWGVGQTAEYIGGEYTNSGYLFVQNVGLFDVNDLLDSSADGYKVVWCEKINDNAWIAGTAKFGGEHRAIVLIPND